MYTTEFSSVNPNNTYNANQIPVIYSWLGDKNGNGIVDANEIGATPKSVFTPKANSIDPNLKDPKNDEIMFAFQRELANNWSLNVDWIQRWFRDATTNQNCYGLPCDQVASTVYAPTRVVSDPGPDQIVGTGDDRQLTLYDVLPAYRGKDVFL